MPFAPDQHPVQALATHRADETLHYRVGAWRLQRCGEDLDLSTRRDFGKVQAVFGIVIADQLLGSLTERRRLAQLLSYPLVRRMASHPQLDYPPRTQFDDDEGKQRAEEYIRDLDEIAGPDRLGLVVQERRPGLPRRSRWPRLMHVFLDDAFADMYPQFQQLASNAFSTPQPVLPSRFPTK